MNFDLMSLHAAIVFGIDESHIFRLIKQKNSFLLFSLIKEQVDSILFIKKSQI